MSIVGQDLSDSATCVNHRRRPTALRCGKCGDYICVKCMVQTPVGVRCKPCAGLRRLPQFDVGPWLLLRSSAAGVVTSAFLWFVLSFIPFLSFFLAILVGAGVGEVMSRLARRRVTRLLEVSAVISVVLGMAIVYSMRHAFGTGDVLTSALDSPAFVVQLLFPAVIASFVAIVKLR